MNMSDVIGEFYGYIVVKICDIRNSSYTYKIKFIIT